MPENVRYSVKTNKTINAKEDISSFTFADAMAEMHFVNEDELVTA